VLLAGGEVVAGDEVLVAVGSRPNTEWLAGSGLPVGDGVVCDAYCEAAAGICAAGLYSPPGQHAFPGPPRRHADAAGRVHRHPGTINIGTAIVCATAGSVPGSLVQYALGARLGPHTAPERCF